MMVLVQIFMNQTLQNSMRQNINSIFMNPICSQSFMLPAAGQNLHIRTVTQTETGSRDNAELVLIQMDQELHNLAQSK